MKPNHVLPTSIIQASATYGSPVNHFHTYKQAPASEKGMITPERGSYTFSERLPDAHDHGPFSFFSECRKIARSIDDVIVTVS